MKTLAEIAVRFRDAFNYDPGHSDLDREQPINISVTLGDWRDLNAALSSPAGFLWRPHTWKPLESDPVSCVVAFISYEEETEAVLSGIFLWRNGEFVNEDDGFSPTPPFFWVYERDLTASVPLPPPSGDEERP